MRRPERYYLSQMNECSFYNHLDIIYTKEDNEGEHRNKGSAFQKHGTPIKIT